MPEPTRPAARTPLRKTGHPHALAARSRKQEEAAAIGIDAAYIERLVTQFYARIRDDTLLGPIFAARIADWDEHLERMQRFWRSILLNSGEFSGNPMLKHLAIPGLDLMHFNHWLELFYATLNELGGDPAAGNVVGTKAQMIADSLLTAIALQRGGPTAAQIGEKLPYV